MSILDDTPDFSGTEWDHVSENGLIFINYQIFEILLISLLFLVAKNLVKRLLIKDPRKRITLRETLQHPWIVGKDFSRTPLPVYSSIPKTPVYRCFNPRSSRLQFK